MNKKWWAILALALLFSFSAKADFDSEKEYQNTSVLSCVFSVLSCVFEEKLIRIYPSGVLYFLTGMNGNPDGMIALDVNKEPHVIYFTKDSPYKCSLTEETEM